MGKLTENLFGARKAAGYKDRCVHCDSKKNTFQERERTANEHSAYKPSAGERLAGEAPLQFAVRSKE